MVRIPCKICNSMNTRFRDSFVRPNRETGRATLVFVYRCNRCNKDYEYAVKHYSIEEKK